MMLPVIQIEAPSLIVEDYDMMEKGGKCLDDSTVTKHCIIGMPESSDDKNSDDGTALRSFFTEQNELPPSAGDDKFTDMNPNEMPRNSIYTIDSYEMEPSSASVNSDSNGEGWQKKDVQSMKMLGTLSLFIKAIKENGGSENDSVNETGQDETENNTIEIPDDKTVLAEPVNGRSVSARPVNGRPVDGRPVDARPGSARPVSATQVSAKPVGVGTVVAIKKKIKQSKIKRNRVLPGRNKRPPFRA